MGRLIERVGDLFDSDAPVIGHGCNIRGAMASGIASAFKARYPEMEAQYRQHCNAKALLLGDVMWWFTDKRYVANMMTQVNPGPDARYLGVERAAVKVLTVCANRGIDRFALPRIGCGIGGLTWAGGVRNLLAELAGESTVNIEVWTPPGR